MGVTLRDVEPRDHEAVLALNQAALPAVGDSTLEEIVWFDEHARYFRVAEDDGLVVGFLIGLTPEAPYESENFAWFRRHYDSFAYVDRIVIDESRQGTGLGRRFYADFEDFGRRCGETMIACEVNTRPRNDGSLRFHGTLGFVAVGTQETEGGTKTVVLLRKPITDA